MSRRPLGAQLPPDVRLAAYEARIRAFQAVVDDELAGALYALDTGQDPETGDPLSSVAVARLVRRALVSLLEVGAGPIRAPLKRSPAVDGPRRP